MTSPNSHAGHVPVEGVVEGRNERGLKVGGEWLNLSKYRPIQLPDPGARVRAEVDARGFISSLEVLEPASQTPAVSRSERDATINRLAVLKAAAHFLGLMSQTREDVRSEHVLVLADKWLAWIEQ